MKRDFKNMREFFALRRRWFKGGWENGHGAYCLLGGCHRVYSAPGRQRAVKERIVDAIRELFPDRYRPNLGSPIASFNDMKETTYDDIVRVVRRARA